MAHSFTLRGLPQTWGSTIIQSSTVLNEVDAFEPLATSDLDRIVLNRRDEFFNLPPTNEYPKWKFYRRKDMGGIDAIYRTIVAVKVTPVKKTRAKNDPTTGKAVSFDSWQYYVENRAWYFVAGTWTSTEVYDLVHYFASAATSAQDPETRSLALPTSGYQAAHEVQGFLFKPVAANVPLNTPIFTAIGYGNPNAA
jgi:hypothetical protein